MISTPVMVNTGADFLKRLSFEGTFMKTAVTQQRYSVGVGVRSAGGAWVGSLT
jgi:hypothetical protein